MSKYFDSEERDQAKQIATLVSRLRERRKFIQVLAGPRQTGKTTIARQLAVSVKHKVHYVSADETGIRSTVRIDQQWETARAMAQTAQCLFSMRFKKIPGWSETIKRLGDADTARRIAQHVVILCSTPLVIQKGLTESLAGRFEIVPVTHWSFTEMREAFGWTPDEYVYYGGYPGSASLIGDRDRWARYIMDSLIETTISRDILLMTRVDKPALLRQLFHIGCSYSGQIVTCQKLVGQLQDAGNTTTLSHYLQLLHGAGMLAGVPKYSGKKILQRSSSPKLIVLNTALMSAVSHLSMPETKSQPELWGRLVESAVGAHCINSSFGTPLEVFYWRERDQEVDFVVRKGKNVVAIEVKSGRKRENVKGMELFAARHTPARMLLIGEGGISVNEFLNSDPGEWLQA